MSSSSSSGSSSVIEHAMGALHNILLTDTKAKRRAMDASIAEGIARILSARVQPESHLVNVRVNMLIGDLVMIPDLQDRVNDAAKNQGWRLPTLASVKRPPTKFQMVQQQQSHNAGGGVVSSPRIKELATAATTETDGLSSVASAGLDDEEERIVEDI